MASNVKFNNKCGLCIYGESPYLCIYNINIMCNSFKLKPALMSGLIVWAALFTSCVHEDMHMPDTPDHTVYLRLNLHADADGNRLSVHGPTPVLPIPALTRAVDEQTINTVDVISFKVDPSDPLNIRKGGYFYRARGVYDPSTQIVQVRLIGDVNEQTLVVLANLREQVNTLQAFVGEAKEPVLARLLLPSSVAHQPAFGAGMAMWGELPAQLINGSYVSTPSQPKSVDLLRAVAKVSIHCPSSYPRHFFSAIESVRLYNGRRSGRATPDNYLAASTAVAAPTTPAGSLQPPGTFHDLIGPGTPSGPITEGQTGVFYLYEADNAASYAVSALHATCLVVRVRFSYYDEGKQLIGAGYPETGYYRIDFKDYAAGTVYDILRNHHYRIEVESVDGLPATTADEAYRGNHTLKCRVVPWNDVRETMRVPMSKRLIVNTRHIDFGRGNTPRNLVVTTENTGGWRMDPGSVPSWIIVTGSREVTTDTRTTLTIVPNVADRDNSGELILMAGRLRVKIRLSQRGNP